MSSVMRLARCACAGLLVAVAARSQSAVPTLEAQLVAGGLTAPCWAGSPPGETGRIFVLELAGRIRLVKDGVLQPAPVLDIANKAKQGAQSGLLGMAFHPDFASNGWFYVYYSISGSSSTVERYTVSASDPDVADPASALPMLSAPISDPVEYHMGGGMGFGPDGKLYVAIGDARDSPSDTCASQRLDTLLGKILRLDDDGGIPADNPFVGLHGARPEIWDLGLREPFRLSFDPANGDLYIGDVGEGSWEEVDVHPGTAPGGLNFGWRVMEGASCTGASQCAAYPCPAPTYMLPAFAFPHADQMCCILGGGVYHGAKLPALQGAYVYGDYCTGALFMVRVLGGVATGNQALNVIAAAGAIDELVSLGVDGSGEPLLLDLGHQEPGQGEIWRLVVPEFADLGGALGTPAFTGQGAPLAGESITLKLAHALPGAAAHLVAGAGTLDLPFKGGLMVPHIDFILSGLSVSEHGTLPLAITWPSGLPTGTSVVLQWWIEDPSGPKGFTASNALGAVAL